MKILLTTPTHRPHGGVRIILDWAFELERRGHDVSIVYPSGDFGWYGHPFKIIPKPEDCDLFILTSPHDTGYFDFPARKMMFLQMMEHLFRPTDKDWQKQCEAFYTAPYPLAVISEWNYDYIDRRYDRLPEFYIHNCVNTNHFPIESWEDDGNTILVEGIVPSNPAKDVSMIGWSVAKRLMEEGYVVNSYGFKKPNGINLNGRFYPQPRTKVLNTLYKGATLVLKASLYDARSCVPMEAMTKGTPTARAIYKGDDDLKDGYNCRRVRYSEKELYEAAKQILTDHDFRKQLSANCHEYIKTKELSTSFDFIEKIILSLAQ